MSNYLLIVKGDSNDCDYVHCITELTEDDGDVVKVVQKCAEAIKNKRKDCSWIEDWNRLDGLISVDYEGVLTEEEIEIFNDIAPRGIHSINSIECYEIISHKVIL